MNEFKYLNGYAVKDAAARNRITYLENNAIEGYDASWIFTSELRTAENFKDLYDAVTFNMSNRGSQEYKNKKIDIFFHGGTNINYSNSETLDIITEGSDYENSSYKISIASNYYNNNTWYNDVYEVTKATDNTISYNIVYTEIYGQTVMNGSVSSAEATLLGKTLSYPTGFTQANSIVLGYMIKYSGSNSWSTCAVTKDGQMTDYANNLIVKLNESNIVLNNIYAYLNEIGYDYRIVLMKIPVVQ